MSARDAERDPQSDNADWLRARFAEALLAQRPESVLDIGCGRGALLLACRTAGVIAAGVESDPECREAVHDAGFELVPELEACGDRAFGWCAMRHVPHHLPDPRHTFVEALRICRDGLLVAEPWFDRDDAAQAVAADFDDWLKREHRRRGRVHGPNLTLDELTALAEGHGRVVAHEYVRRPTARPLSDLVSEAEAYLGDLAADAVETLEYRELLARARMAGLSCNGSLVVRIVPTGG